MNLAEPARPVAPATADAAPVITPSFSEPAVEAAPANADPAPKVDPAVLYDDAREFAPVNQLNESHTRGIATILPEHLKATGAHFAAPAAVSRGRKASFVRKVLPFLFDPRDFVSYGEVARYVIMKDNTAFIYTEESDTNPLYTIPLETLSAIKEDPKKPHKHSVTISPSLNTNLPKEEIETILLLDDKEKLQYQFTFDVSQDRELATNCILAIRDMHDINMNPGKNKHPIKK